MPCKIVGKLVHKQLLLAYFRDKLITICARQSAWPHRTGRSTQAYTYCCLSMHTLPISSARFTPTLLSLLTFTRHLMFLGHRSSASNYDSLKWFSSFLTDRTQQVKAGLNYSRISQITSGVVHSSVLRPLIRHFRLLAVTFRRQP